MTNRTKHTTEELWHEFSDNIRAFVRHRVGNTSLVDDIVQDIFLKIHLNIDLLKDSSTITSWVYRIAHNTVVDRYRRQKPMTVDIDHLQLADQNPEETPAQEVAAGLRDMVGQLPEKYAQALLLVEFEGVPQTTLAQELGLSVSAAKSRVQRGRRMLRDSLMKCCHFQFDRFGTIIDVHPHSCCCCSTSASS